MSIKKKSQNVNCKKFKVYYDIETNLINNKKTPISFTCVTKYLSDDVKRYFNPIKEEINSY